MKLQELLDNPVPWERSEEQSPYEYSAEFDVEGVHYSATMIGDKDHPWELLFKATSGRDGWGITGTGNQFTVFATVFDFVKEAIKAKHMESFYFTAKESSRKRLYKLFAVNLAKAIGYTYKMIEEGEESYFIFVR